MKKQFLTLLVATATAFTACKDNDDPVIRTKVLSKLISIEDGDTTTHAFNYDSNKRLTSFGTADNTEKTSFTYDAGGNLTKVENIEGDSKQVFEAVYTNAIPVTGSLKTYDEGQLQSTTNLEYTIASGKVTEIIQKVQTQQSAKSTLTYQNGNVTKIETVLTAGGTYTRTYTYGTKKSMLTNPAVKYVLDPAGITASFIAKNEVLTENFDSPGTEFDVNSNTVYTYDSQGYPLTATVTSDEEVVTLKFEYKEI
ncbi:RHS repeat domain-containing protein [Paradesertivirga mongoliensis]|uniref:RHS repeat domain-containing protein n=1 Tax=Paradesertivirga mongoliensis TaxID=2100740 RepID=A0ABW4ZHV3_9SPHI|nr:RHS repeat domain-containing protein [Pedobacter mongoliensis]